MEWVSKTFTWHLSGEEIGGRISPIHSTNLESKQCYLISRHMCRYSVDEAENCSDQALFRPGGGNMHDEEMTRNRCNTTNI